MARTAIARTRFPKSSTIVNSCRARAIGPVLERCFGTLRPEPNRLVGDVPITAIGWGPGAVTIDMLFIGCRVCVRCRRRTHGQVVRLMPMTGRVVVRLDPPHPNWRGALRSFRPEQLAICP